MFTKKEKEMFIIKPHRNISRPAKDKDAMFIARQASDMMLLAARIEHERKLFSAVYAVHHSQVSKNPINFFVLNPTNPIIVSRYEARDSFVVINPKIISTTRHTVDSEESCLSFPGYASTIVQRYHKIVVEYQILVEQDNGEFMLSIPRQENVSSVLAKVFQHEIQHAEGVYIYGKI